LFAGFGQSELDAIEPLLRRAHYQKGSVIFREGDPGDELLIVTNGTASAYLQLPQMNVRLASFAPGTMFGELALLDQGPRSATVIADEELICYALSKANFAVLAAKVPDVAIRRGTADIVARLVGQCLSEKLNQQFVIENRPGAGTNIATETVVRAPPDGYTLLAAASTNTINPAFYSNLNFNFVRDVTMVSGISRQPLVLDVHPSLPVTSVPELIAYAKANPGQITMASFGTGTTSQAAIELFKMMASLLHVPYHGSAPMVTDLLGGRVQTAIDALPTSLEHIKAGKLRAVAVTTATRSEALAGRSNRRRIPAGLRSRGMGWRWRARENPRRSHQ
jgi:hypothetical protein